MSNLNQNTVDLQAILDAVNALPESTDLTPIVEALTEKGQTVPDGANVDVLASLIAAIEAGGGGFGNGVNVITGTVTPATNALTLTIGQKIPSNKKHVLIVVEDSFNSSSRALTLGVFYGTYKQYSECFGGNSTSTATCTLTVDLETGTYTCGNTYWLFSGSTYYWMVICGK